MRSIGKFPNIRKENIDKNLLSSFNIQKDLNKNIWDDNDQLKPNIRANLLIVGKDFFDYLKLNTEIKDILLTGSLAGYGYSKYSDIDLHVVFDFNDVKESDDPEFIREYVNSKKGLWNDIHNIKIKNFEIEIYPQDLNELHRSTGIYSILNDKWIKKPVREEFKIDYHSVKNKAEQLMREIDKLYKNLKNKNDLNENLIENINPVIH